MNWRSSICTLIAFAAVGAHAASDPLPPVPKIAPKSADRINAINNVLLGWAETDPSSTAAWAQKLPKGGLRTRSLQTVIAGMTRENLQQAFDLARTVAVGNAAVGPGNWGGDDYFN